ncbi:motile sperm domain-containing protein 3 [Elgaria multicarinata webbii]|uniref:motile sperm domain-containing protein 3 n=1 Tax=Elgaria multicarinata webbii TaxID=159646 RepID=UPI002FCD04D3
MDGSAARAGAPGCAQRKRLPRPPLGAWAAFRPGGARAGQTPGPARAHPPPFLPPLAQGRLPARRPVALLRGSARPGPAQGGQLPPRAVAQHQARLVPLPPGRGAPSIPPRLFILYLAVAAVCLGLLMLPLQGQPSPLLPSAFRITLPQKLVAAYVLGLLTMVFLRSGAHPSPL